MSWLLDHWQTIATLGVVALTALVFSLRLARRNGRSGCGSGCACPTRPGHIAGRR